MQVRQDEGAQSAGCTAGLAQVVNQPMERPRTDDVGGRKRGEPAPEGAGSNRSLS